MPTQQKTNTLRDTDAAATLAVKDLEAAAKFYEHTLGLSRAGAEGDEVIVFESGDTLINVYRSSFAGTNKATALTWTVGDEVEAIARALKAKGVSFERYDMPGMTLKGDVHIASTMKIAWFKDPDGNILSIVSG